MATFGRIVTARAVRYRARIEAGSELEGPQRRVLVGIGLEKPDGTVEQGYGGLALPVDRRFAARLKRRLLGRRAYASRDEIEGLLDRVVNSEVDLTSPASSVLSVAQIMASIPAQSVTGALGRGPVGALEMALLDAVARAHQVSVAELLFPVSTPSPAPPLGRRKPATALGAAAMAGAGQRIDLVRDAHTQEESGLAAALAHQLSVGAGRAGEALTRPDGLEDQVTADLIQTGLGQRPDWAAILSGTHLSYMTTEPLEAVAMGDANVYERAAEIGFLGPNGAPAQAFAEATLGRGLGIVRYTRGSFVAFDNVGREFPFMASRTQLSGVVGSAVCNNKQTTRSMLDRHGVPTAQGRIFPPEDRESAVEYAKQLGFPVVLKPAMGFRGIGVFANIRDEEALREAFVMLGETSLAGQEFLIEEHVAGEEYRILVVGDRAVAAIHRSRASATADGVYPVGELILRKNLLRRFNPSLRFRPIRFDGDCRFELRRQDLTLHDVPEPGRVVTLSSTSNLSQGGDSTDVLGLIHPSILDASVRAVQAIPNLGFAGVDFLVEDLSLPLDKQKTAVLEVNAGASISGGVYPMYGEPRDVAGPVLDALAEKFAIDVADRVRGELSVRIVSKGRLPSPKFEERILRVAEDNQLKGTVTRVNKRTVEIMAQGPVDRVATMSIAAVLGPRGTKPTSATTEHVEPFSAEGFSIVPSPGKRVRRA